MKPPGGSFLSVSGLPPSNTMQVDAGDHWNTCSRPVFSWSMRFFFMNQVKSVLFMWPNITDQIRKKHFFFSIFLRLSKRLESQEYSIFQSCPPSTFKQMRCILYTFSYKHNPPKGALSPSNTNTVAISSKIQRVLTGCSSLWAPAKPLVSPIRAVYTLTPTLDGHLHPF